MTSYSRKAERLHSPIVGLKRRGKNELPGENLTSET
jgi:hypothetical protein